MVKILASEVIAETVTIHGLVDQFIQHGYEVEQHSKWTMRTRTTHLKQFAQYCDAKELYDPTFLTLPFLDEYFADYTKTHNKSTVNTGRRIIKVFFAWVIDYKEIMLRFDESRIRLVKVRDDLPKYIERAIIETVIRGTRRVFDRLLIALAFEAGLRITELVNVRVKDVTKYGVHVLGKGAIDRVVPITDKLFASLQIYAKGRSPEDYLFTNHSRGSRSDVLTIGAARRHIEVAFEKFGVKMYPHQLRHSLAVELLKNGCDVVTIQHVLGHTDLKTTMKYLRISNSFMNSQYKSHFGKSVI